MPQSQPGSGTSPASSSSASPSPTAGGKSAAPTLPTEKAATDPIALLSADHRHVEQLFAEFEKATESSKKQQLARQVCDELVVHTLLEEEIFYPACQGRMERRL